jgi:tRNA modification GTPase
LAARAIAKIKVLRDEIEKILAAQGKAERLRDGLVVAIAGPPNVGKSTLMNQLARREVAIVSPHAGTTRDIIEVQLDLDGYPVTVMDTAGIRETEDPVEQEGVRRARLRAAEADLVLWLADADDALTEANSDTPIWLVRTKIDLDTAAVLSKSKLREFRISAARGDGIGDLVGALVGFAADYFGTNEGALITRERQRKLLEDTAAALERSLASIGRGEELAAEDLRSAATSLGRLLGRVDVEDILDVIFREFCIGK